MNRIKNHLPLHLLRPALAYLAFAVVIATITATFLAPSTASATIAAPADTAPSCEPTVLEARAAKKTAAAKAPAKKRSTSKKNLTGKLNINTATSEQLQLLPGVGPAKADRVVAYRKSNGPFKRVKDLRRVKGFGYKSLQKLEKHLATSGATTLQASSDPTAAK
jgi:competence protein ComEA